MIPSEKLSRLIGVVRLCTYICGADIIDRNYKINFITLLVLISIATYFICLGYTIGLKFTTDFIYVLETLSVIGTAVQGLSKLVTTLMYRSALRLQYELLQTIYVQYEGRSKEYFQVLNRCITRIEFALKIAACIYIFVFVAFVSMPFLILALTGRRILPLQILLPMLDVDTSVGYFVTVGVHVICILFGTTGNFASDMFMLVYFAHCVIFVDIFRLKAGELNELAIDFGSQKARDQLKDVIEWHQAYSNFIEKNEMLFWWSNFTQITTSALSIALTLVLLFISDWPGPYVYIWLSFSMMYLYCGMGTVVEAANDRFTDEIYAIHWYLLTIPQQKAVRFMLMKSQQPKKITIGGVAPLSVSTGLQVTKTIYSFFMMLLNFLH